MTMRRTRSGVEDRWFRADGERTTRHGIGKRWRARYVDERGREHSAMFARKIDAKKWLDGQVSSVVSGRHVAPADAALTVSEWSAIWLEGYAVNRESTVREAKTHLRRIESEFGHMALSAVRPSHIKGWTARLKADGLEQSYVYALHSRLAQVLGDAVTDGVLGRNPCSRKTSPPMGKAKVYVATTEQIWAIHDAVPDHLRVAVLLGAFAGLRVAEVSGLRTADVDFIRGVVHPKQQWGGKPLKTVGSNAEVPIPQDLALLLSASVQQYPSEMKMMVTNGPGTDQCGPWIIERAIRDVRESIDGLPEGFSFHDLRHYLASLLIASGADVKTVQARMRHASARTTLDTYSHLWPDADESTRAAVDVVIKNRLRENSCGPTAVPDP
jgi:integrase